jgi:hypothetical protein
VSRLSTIPSSGSLHIPGGSLASWRSALRHELPEIRDFGWRGEWSRHKGKVDGAFLERLNGIFTGIENYNASPGKALSEIYVRPLSLLACCFIPKIFRCRNYILLSANSSGTSAFLEIGNTNSANGRRRF